MLALTLRHPWPFCICHLGKRIENRSWKPWPKVIGEYIAIHGGKGPKGPNAVCGVVRSVQLRVARDRVGMDVVMPGIVAVAKVTGFVTASDDPWFEGPFGWTLEDVFVLPEVVPCKGAQGLWQVPFVESRRIVEQCQSSSATHHPSTVRGLTDGGNNR